MTAESRGRDLFIVDNSVSGWSGLQYLRDQMDWPIGADDFEELTYEYTPEELGIDTRNAAKIQEIKRLRPLVTGQPWGIFFVEFEPRRLPVAALRRILSQVALEKRASANPAERTAWATDDLLFVSNFGEGEERQISFAHFSEARAGADLPTLEVLGWNNLDSPLHLDAVARELTQHLAWPDDTTDLEAWRKNWRAAFTPRHREVITTSKNLSIGLARLAGAIRDRIGTVLAIETDSGPLTRLLAAFREALVHDLDPGGFADMYAQTIAYGLLSARIANPGGETADDLPAQMPVTNPFLKELMETILHVGGRRGQAGGPGIDFDELGVGEIVELLDDPNTHLEAVVRDFGDRNPQEDPVIHFYEHFLAEYDKQQRMQRGVFYTPRPVVSFIVRSVDELLRTELGLEDGLADISTWAEMAERRADLAIPEGTDPDQAFVQILDPATGTGTFLVEVIDLIHRTMTEKWKGEGHRGKKLAALWSEYVPEHLLPRLHGYELLMAPYAIAHLKVGLRLLETGYDFSSDERARIYLTNALEPAKDSAGTLAFASPSLAHEAEAVNLVKRHQQFTVVLGNPPYAQYSMNLDDDAKKHIEKFRFANGKKIRARNALQLERNLNDDYVKFLGYAADRIPACGGVLGIVTNRMFLESESLTGLREWFTTNFPRSYIVDLHGSNEESRRVERLAHDENVFDIQQGVAVSFFVRRRLAAGEDCSSHALELVGDRQHKYTLLSEELCIENGSWSVTMPTAPHWWLDREEVVADSSVRVFALDEIFPKFSTLVASNRDHLVVDFDRKRTIAKVRAVQDFDGTNEELCERFGITLKRGWNVTGARERLGAIDELGEHTRPIEYRPFDRRWIFFHPTLVWQTAPICSQNVLDRPNRVLISLGKNRAETINGQWVTATLADKSVVTTRDNASGFPLYLYEDPGDLNLSGADQQDRCPNLGREFLGALAEALGVESTRPFGLPEGCRPEDILHYVYALLQSPSYRAHHAHAIVGGFPPVPVIPSETLFRDLVRLGGDLVALHLMESAELDDLCTTYTGPENPEVEKIGWSEGTVWLDARKTKSRDGHRATQPGTIGFDGVPEEVWDFHVGGHRVCHKWLEVRKGRTLGDDELAHYQRIVAALGETIRTTREIDELIENHGGWPGAFQATAPE